MLWRIRALRSIVLRRGGLDVSFWLSGTLRDECSALRLVELDVAPDFARLAVTENFPDRGERERQ
eukprot:4878748-Pleurochrysis_carterae.AAC.1